MSQEAELTLHKERSTTLQGEINIMQALQDELKSQIEAAFSESRRLKDQSRQTEKVTKDLATLLSKTEADRDHLQSKLADTQKSRTFKQPSMLEPGNEQSYNNQKLKYLTNKMKCGSCNINEKQVMLPCLHMFCEDCITKNIEARVRHCPLDRQKFSKNEVKKMIWGGDESL